MAMYRTIQLSFWTDLKVETEFTPEDKYFFLYLMTNPHTNLLGCYQIGVEQISKQTGYTVESVRQLLNRTKNVHKVIDYCEETKEVLILNWYKYNWTSSPKVLTALTELVKHTKCLYFKGFLEDAITKLSNKDTVCIGYIYPMDTSVTVNNNNYIYSNTKYSYSLNTTNNINTISNLDTNNNLDNRNIYMSETSNSIISLILKDNTEYEITEDKYKMFCECYPDIDVMAELKSMKAWCISNKDKRKTRKGVDRFINSWLSNAKSKVVKKPNKYAELEAKLLAEEESFGQFMNIPE